MKKKIKKIKEALADHLYKKITNDKLLTNVDVELIKILIKN